VSTELPKVGFMIWVEIAPTTSHDRLTCEDDGRIIVTDTLTSVPDGRGGTEHLFEEVTREKVAEAVAGDEYNFPAGALWRVVGAYPGVMAE
jgi:hypothetical protein